MRSIVIVGGGIMGVSTAYHLIRLAVDDPDTALAITILERETIACAASGTAGGFLARSWCKGPTGPLAEASFDMHTAQIAELSAASPALAHTLGFRLLPSYFAAPEGSGHAAERPAWLNGHALGSVIPAQSPQDIAQDGIATGQLTPGPYTRALLDAAVDTAASLGPERARVSVREGAVATGLAFDSTGAVVGVLVDGDDAPVPADDVVLAMGPWTGDAAEWFAGASGVGDLAVGGQIAYSCVFGDAHIDPSAAAAVFYETGTADTEVFPRPDGTVYVCSGNEPTVPLPASASAVVVDEDAVAELAASARSLSSVLAHAPLVHTHACFLPIRLDPDASDPLIGSVYRDNVFVCAGHSCWGILLSAASGAGLASLILTGSPPPGLDLSGFDPGAEPLAREPRAGASCGRI